MPSASRFASLRRTVRNHPVVVSTSAATAGVLLGAFVAVQLLATPKPPSDSAGTAQAAVEAKAAPKPAPETTGSAPTGESVASSDCDQQTWPHLSRVCMEEFRNKNRSTRVVTTDKLEKPTITAIETQPAVSPAPPAAVEQPKLAPPPGAVVASTTPPARAPVPAVTPAAMPQPVLLAPATAQTAEAPSRPAATTEAKERRLKKSTRKPKGEPRAPAKQDMDGDNSAVASIDSDDGIPDDRGAYRRAERRGDGRADRSRRIVERWTERDYDVPDSRGGRRQVTVIRRNNGGGLFESLFGN